jgi:hypothetical protein
VRNTKDWAWELSPNAYGKYDFPSAHLAVLMDIRDELKRLNNVLQCPNFIAVPRKLDDIKGELRQVRLNTRRKKRPAVGKPKLRVVTG